MSDVMQFDQETSRRVETTYTTADVVEQRRIVREALALKPGEHVLDIGSGPGFLAVEMAAEVRPHGQVSGVEPSASMLALAQQRRREPGSVPVEFRTGEATALPYPDGSFDAITSTQVYEYVQDVPAALAQARRVLRPGGRLLILDTDWDSIVWRCTNRPLMRRILTAWDEHLTDPHLPQRLTGLLTDAGLTVTHRAAVPLLNTAYNADTFSAGLVGFITAFVPGRRGLTETHVQAWVADVTGQGRDYFMSLNRYLFLATKN
jgi:ubiquinone/menaquinone biosynthesis C-methylase UbiE